MRLAFFAQLQSGSISYWVHFLSMNDRSKSTKTLWNNIWIKGRIERQDYRVKRSKRIGFAGILLWERENEREEKPPALRLIRYINERIGKAFHSCWFYMLNKFHLVAVKVSLWSGCTKKALYRRALRTSGIRWIWKWWKNVIATVAPALFSFAECPHLFSRYHFLLHRCSRFEFFPSLSVFFANTRKHRATVKPENRYMKPESTETHFAYLFHFVGFYFSSSFHPHWLGSSTISSKSLAFIFLLRCMKLIVFSLSSIFYSKVVEEK